MRARWSLALGAAALLSFLRAPAARADEPPAINRDKPFMCLYDGDNKLWRVQCSDLVGGHGLCVYSPDAELDENKAPVRGLERALPCYKQGPFDQDGLAAQGYRLIYGTADAPYGWMRDERNRVFQVNFDLHRRMYVGGFWSPHVQDGTGTVGSGGADFGLLDFTYFNGVTESAPTRHRLALVKGDVRFAPFTARMVMVHYDISRRYARPLLRLTTFFGTPRRHDARINIGGWFEGGDLEVRDTPSTISGGRITLWRMLSAYLTADLWQSRDLYSFVRVRAGAGIERAIQKTGADLNAWTPGVAVDVDLTLDRDGFHHIVVNATYEVPQYYGDTTDPLIGTRARRFQSELGYEAIILAVNDQPVSVRVSA